MSQSGAHGEAVRVCFVARYADTFLGERARGLSRYFSSSIQVRYQFVDTGGVWGSARCFWALLSAARHQDVLWLISQHPARLLAALVGRMLFGTRFIVDTADLLYESARVAGRNTLVCQLIRSWEDFSVRVPDAVVVHGTFHHQLLEKRGIRRLAFIPDGVECSEFGPRSEPQLRNTLGLDKCLTIGVLATIGWEAHLKIPSPGWDLVECLVRLPDLPLKAVVIGDGPGLAALKALAVKRGVADRMVYVGRIAYGEVPRFLAVIDVCLHTALNNSMAAVRTTGKLPIMLSCGCCMLVSAVGEATRVLAGMGMLVRFDGSFDDYAAVLAARLRTLVETQECLRIRQLGPEIARREFDYPVLSQRAVDLIAVVAARNRHAGQ